MMSFRPPVAACRGSSALLAIPAHTYAGDQQGSDKSRHLARSYAAALAEQFYARYMKLRAILSIAFTVDQQV